MFHRNTYAGHQRPAFFWAFAPILILSVFYNAANIHAQALRLPVTTLTVGTYEITVEIAATEKSRNYGLMNRMSLPGNTGMLFVFDSVSQPCFWMKNTPLPLSIAFIDRDGYIVNIAQMQPYSTTNHCPSEPVLYALEMAQGWYANQGIKAGTRITNLPAS